MRREPSNQTTYYCDQLKGMRTRGQLQDAYRLGKQLHERFPDDEYIEGAFSWVIYDCLKRYKDEKSKYHKDLPAFLKTLRMIPSLRFDAYANDLFFENIAKYLIAGIGWDLRSEQNITELQSLFECLTELDSQEESHVYKTMIAYLEEPIRALAWDYRKANDLEALLYLLGVLASINPQTVLFLHEPLVMLGWDYRQANNVDGLLVLLNAISSLGDIDAYFRDKDTLLMFAKGFEPAKNPSDAPLMQAKKAKGTVALVEWFELENLTQDMFQEEEYKGKTQQSLAEKIVNLYTDALGLKNQNGHFVFDDARIRMGLNSLENVIQSSQAERWIWPQYKCGKLLMQVDGAHEARPFFAKVLLGKWDEPYIWGAFADTFLDDDITAYAKCLFRGLRLSRNTGFSLALHEKAMLYLKSIRKYPEAKREALIVSEYRKGQGWPESGIVESEMNEGWFDVVASDDNLNLYQELSVGSEVYVFPYATKSSFYVEWIDDEKGLMGIASEGIEEPQPRRKLHTYRFRHPYTPNWAKGITRTVIKDREVRQSVEIGVCYEGILSKDKKAILGNIERCASEDFAQRFTIEFEGTFDLVKYKDKQGIVKAIGFVRDTQRGSLFVPPTLFNDSNLTTFDLVKGTARAIFKDDQWTMEVTNIEFLGKPNLDDIEREVSGKFERTRQSFGFVGDCFVPQNLVLTEKLRECDYVTVLARKSWDKKKDKWSWTATKIIYKEPYNRTVQR